MSALILSAVNLRWDVTQTSLHLYCSLLVAGTSYPPGGIVLDSVLLALPEVTTTEGVQVAEIFSRIGSGYIYQRIASTGKMMVLQVPPNGSLTTAAPLQQFPSSQNVQGIVNDDIFCHALFARNQ